ncbi:MULTISPECIES: metal-dependent hydrolase [Tenacibaculum]|uniref:metal-dependent hydrolase n=1 Tax=Tenacibaculum TaxID=104267 RepID=UPI001F0AE6AD|nr:MULTISPECIES: metal-dependent hydrolase [Tenacibaculum]MCH3880874.1 metal-dependent hydrolase [Tenacibaculum aquimarinum]MDO6599527.1 metal-dependent hydrolase [Tenacibaculum sp. 1_MG-2023]
MDSLTQIVLGAACGELVLGKKIGNKAMLFGAIGGTIPDLDVFIGKLFYSNEIDIMMFHRGFMHSILFAFIGAFVFGFLFYKMYNWGKRTDTTTQKDWIWLFFLSIFTHPLLDCFTPYGTQLFAPFTDYRVAFNNISVADPAYTVPFLLCLIIAMFFNRNNIRRKKWVKAGIYLSSIYMLFTIGNKLYMDSVFKKSFAKAGIEYNRFSAQPTILNNVLWYAIAETDTNYKVTFYSLFDKSATADTILTLPKNHDLIDIQHPDIKKMAWFSNNYFNLIKKDSTETVQYNDLRYPLLNSNDPNSSVFSFTLKKEGKRWDIIPFYGATPSKEDLENFKERIKGI